MAIESLQNKAYKHALKLQQRRDFPAAIIASGKSYYSKVDRSGPISPHFICDKLRIRLSSLGGLYTKQNGNYLGCCAEVNAANHVICKLPYIHLKEIEFSNALRPRTMQKIHTCINCKQTFR